MIAAHRFIRIFPGSVCSSLKSEYVSSTKALPVSDIEQQVMATTENG
jgi:hypothetical protein